MEIKHEQIRDALRGWATEATQRTVAAEITRAYFKLKMQAPQLAQIERADGSVDDAAWHNNKQQIFRWLDSDSAGARQKIRELQPAILLRCRRCCAPGWWRGTASNTRNPRAEGTPEAIAAALLHASPADFERECDEAERSFYELRRAYSALH